MSEFEEYYSEEFFIIDSNNLDDIEDKFIGYAIIDNKIVFNQEISDESLLKGEGAYILIKNHEDCVTLSQDFNGSFGIYIYVDKDNNYFAISNSFLKLVEYLKEFKILTFNRKYSEAFLFADLSSYSYEDTLVNEIKLIPRNCNIYISKLNKKIIFDEIDYQEKSISIDSIEGFEILDRWYFKWVELIRSIKKETNNMTFDLSGGFDSRIVASIWLSSSIDLKKVNINSKELEYYRNDYVIASKIADAFNFKLNERIFSSIEEPFHDINTPIKISFYTKLGFHNQMYYKFSKNYETTYHVAGNFGEQIRGYPNLTPDEYIENVLNKSNKYDPYLTHATETVVKNSFDKLANRFNVDISTKRLSEIHYNEVRSRNHFGKASVESLLSNKIILTPLSDQDIRKLKSFTNECKDDLLLIATIFIRYCPKLLEFDFEGNKSIPIETIKYAKKLNEKYPFKPKEFDIVSGPDIVTSNNENQEKLLTKEKINGYFKEIFYSKPFEMEFKKHFSNRSYELVSNTLNKNEAHPLKFLYTSLSSIIIYNLISKNNSYNDILYSFLNDDVYSGPKELTSVNSQLKKFNTARIDIKCFGDDNKVELIGNSDLYATVKNPKWFKKRDGEGFVVESDVGMIDLKLKVKNSSKLKLWFRSKHVKDKNNTTFPLYIDYSDITVDGEKIIDSNILIMHNQPITFEKEVESSQIISIHVEWAPFTTNSEYTQDLSKKISELENKISNLEDENKTLKNQIEEHQNNPGKIRSIFRK